MTEVKATNGKCETTLYQGCELVSCRIHCAEHYNLKNGDGACVEGKTKAYDCVCIYDCNRWLYMYCAIYLYIFSNSIEV